jgi:tripartite-type tricarboxylate transporter receptor subunit TctC
MKTLYQMFGIVLAVALAGAVGAADYPARPVHIVVPFAGGGASDSVARVIAPELAKLLGQPVIVENRPGAEGVIAGQVVAAAPADGYTLLYAISGTAALPIVTKTSYDMTADFTPISTIGNFDFAMFASPAVPPSSVAEFVAYAKANPGRLNFATLNLGEQLAASLFTRASGVRMMSVPYKTMGQIVPDMAADQVHLYFGPVINGIGFAKDGRMRVLATLGTERSPLTPNVATMRELGLGEVTFESTQMLFAPAKTPRPIVERLSRAVNAILAQPEVGAKLRTLSLRPKGSTPEEMGAAQQAANVTWARFARENNLGRD